MTARPPAPPRKPEPYECCGRGCQPCIFDYYDNALARWSERMKTFEAEQVRIEQDRA